MFNGVTLQCQQICFLSLKRSRKNLKEAVYTTGRERSPRISHKSEIARNPTRITTKTPTNLTLTEPANIDPIAESQNHQEKLKGLEDQNNKFLLSDLN